MPSLPIDETESKDREIIDEIKMVADYCNMSISDVLNLPCDFYSLSLKKAFIMRLNSSKEGRNLLKLADDISRTDCDLDMLLNFYGEGE